MRNKPELRKRLKELRREHVAGLPDSVRALMFHRPPSPVVSLVPEGATVGLYSALPDEAPTLAYAKWFHDRGHPLALPWFSERSAAMTFKRWNDPYDDTELATGPFGIAQPEDGQIEIVPEVVVIPLVGFTPAGDRLGQGAGHYDRWLEAHPEAVPIGLAWDCQLVDALPAEPHDRLLRMIVTPTRAYEGMP